MRRRFPRTPRLLLWATAWLALGCGEPSSESREIADAPAPSEPPSLLLVTVDTLRADHVGAYGAVVPTPHLDRLAEEGVLVERASTPTPSTGPAHASLFTGLHPWRHGVLDNAVKLDRRSKTLAEVAAHEGLTTGAFVSSYIVHPRFGLDRGFDEYAFEPTEPMRWRRRTFEFWTRGEHTTAAAAEFLTRQAESGDRFFLWVHYFDPHHPWQPPAGYALGADHAVDLEGKRLPVDVPDLETLRGIIRRYRGEVQYTDAQIGRLVDTLRRLDLLERTTVVVTADHGEGLGDHGLLQHGLNLHGELVQVPLIVRGPGLPAGVRLRGAAQLEDLFPTLISLADLTPVPDVDGIDLAPWLRGEVARSPREAVVGRRKRYRDQPDLYFVERWPEKWIGTLEGQGRRFALDRDPAERSGSPDTTAPERLAGLLERATPGVPAGREQDPEVQSALEALGYAE